MNKLVRERSECCFAAKKVMVLCLLDINGALNDISCECIYTSTLGFGDAIETGLAEVNHPPGVQRNQDLQAMVAFHHTRWTHL